MSSEPRDYKDPKYKQWRYNVFAADGFACQLCDAKGGDTKLEAHHIKRWAQWPNLRFNLGNGISLCKACHELVTNNEEQYEEFFRKKIKIRASLKARKKKKKASETTVVGSSRKKRKKSWRPNPRLRF
jgi:5-methylcytosine-specific restriction endonuclease McrA